MDRDFRRRMNFGCGPIIATGWYNVDIDDRYGAFIADARDGLLWPDDTFDGIVANHSLQCLTGAELDPVVHELCRVLRPGGRLRVLVPDIIAAFYAWEARDERWLGFFAISEDWPLDRKFAHYLTWGGQNRSTFTEETLLDLVERNGFERAHGWNAVTPPDEGWHWLRELDSRLGESIVVEAAACG